MLFSSVLFLFKYLPSVLIGHLLLRNFYRNLFLLIASLFFYYWGEETGIFIMLSSICINYGTALFIDFTEEIRIRKLFLFIGVFANLGLLIFYKYFYFISDAFGLRFDVGQIALPLGISFFTFQGLSYIIDVYRKEVGASRNPLDIALYISLFPQLIAGPIVRYQDISRQIGFRTIGISQFESGIKKFIRGFFKKVVIANNIGLIADLILVQSNVNELPSLVAWIGILSYTIQIYFDFSGYSDMAIGVGRMLGFSFKENFKHPYYSFSIREFWRRWHISLSTWFRDYLYIPLGGNRNGQVRTLVNLLIVFFLTGLWHGASWNFVVWGMIHGFFLILERSFDGKVKLPSIFRYFFTILIVMLAWVFFKIEDFDRAQVFIKKMFMIFDSGTEYYSLLYLTNFNLILIFFSVLLSFPIRKWLKVKLRRFYKNDFFQYLVLTSYLLVFLFSIIELASSNYNPFIYFRF